MTLNYDTLVGFGQDVEPVARLRRILDALGRWPHLDVQDPARHEVVGRPAGDLRGRPLDDAVRPRCDERRSDPRAGLPRAVPDGRRGDRRHGAGPGDPRRHDQPQQPAPPPVVHPDPAQAHLVEARPEDRVEHLPEPGSDRRDGPVPGRRVQARPVRPTPAQRELLGPAGRRRPGRHHDLQEQRHHDPGPQEGRARLRPGRPGRPVRPAEGQSRRPDRDHRGRVEHVLRAGVQLLHQADPGRRRIDQGGPGSRRSATPSATPSTSRPSSTKAFAGHATVGSTQITPFQAGWHAEPNDLRTFDIETAKAKLDAAGYPLDASGRRLDKEGKQITLRLAWPGAPEEATAAVADRRLVRPARDQGQRGPGG